MTIVPFNSNHQNTWKGLSQINQPEDLKDFLNEVVMGMGYRTAAYLTMDPIHEEPRHEYPFFACTYSQKWIDRYLQEGYQSIDPVLQFGLNSLLPIPWDGSDFSTPKLRAFYLDSLKHGLGGLGLTLPIRGRRGERAIFTVTADGNPSSWAARLKEQARDLQVLAYHVHEASNRARGIEAPAVRLSRQEIECLRSAGNGETAAQTAREMRLSVRTVRFYLDTARVKLESINVTHAVAKAIELGLLIPRR